MGGEICAACFLHALACQGLPRLICEVAFGSELYQQYDKMPWMPETAEELLTDGVDSREAETIAMGEQRRKWWEEWEWGWAGEGGACFWR